MGRDMSKVFLNYSGYTFKNLVSVELVREATKALDEADMYGNQDVIVKNVKAMTISITVKKGTDDESLLLNSDTANLEAPVTYKDATGNNTVMMVGSSAMVNYTGRNNDGSDQNATYEMLVPKVTKFSTI